MKEISLVKLLGIVILTMAALVACSFIEVAIYSYLINPGQPMEAYDKHAEETAPIVSCIGGLIIFFLVVRYWKLKNVKNFSRLVILYPVTYVVVDLIILIAASVPWGTYIYIFLAATAAKFLGSFLGAKLTKTENAPA